MGYFARMPKEQKLRMWYVMCAARLEELKIRYDIKESGKPSIPTVALISLGEEAVSIGASFALDPKKDWLMPGHRCKGALIHFGVTPLEDMSNHMCKASSPMRGRDGNVHYAFAEKHIGKFISHMVAGLPTGCGIAEGLRYIYDEVEKRDEDLPVVMCFCGDGASRQGTFHEAVNYAAARNLPVIFVIDNNRIATDTPIEEQLAAVQISDAKYGYNIDGSYIANGNDVVTVYNTAARFIERARKLGRMTDFLVKYNMPRAPSILECMTYRMAEHNETRKAHCVDLFDFIEWGALDPLRLFRETLLSLRSTEALRAIKDREPGSMFASDEREISPEELEELMAKAKHDVDEAYERAKALPDPKPDEKELLKIYPVSLVIKNPRAVEPFHAVYTTRKRLTGAERKGMVTFAKAIQDTLVSEMKKDQKIRVFGEDVGGRWIEDEPRGGGVYNITQGVVSDPELGKARCFNTPLSEIAIVGAAIGQAILGLKPIAEIQYLPFTSVAMSQLIDYLPSWFWTAGIKTNLVLRMPCGGGMASGDFHASMRLEASFFHTPGLKIVHPATPSDAAALLRASIHDESPVLYFENIWGYSRIVGTTLEEEIPLGKAALRQEGKDLTIVAWGSRTWFDVVLPAVEKLTENGVSIELIDLRSLAPLDMDLLAASLKKTNRCLIVHEDMEYGGIGQAVAYMLQKEAGEYNLAPTPLVVGARHSLMPQHPDLERWYLPSEERVLEEARHLLAFK